VIQADLLDLSVVDEPKQECVLAIHFPLQSWLLGDKVTIRCLNVQGQKVNYNLKQLTQKAWKNQDESTSARVPANAPYPAEDDYTDALFRVHQHSHEHLTGACLESPVLI